MRYFNISLISHEKINEDGNICLKDLKTRKEAILSGIIGAFLAMIPGFMIYFSLLSHYPWKSFRSKRNRL